MAYQLQNWTGIAHNGLGTGVSPKARRGKERLYGKHINAYREALAGCSCEQMVEIELINTGVLNMPQKVIRARKFVEENTVGVIANQTLTELRKWDARFINPAVKAKLAKAIALRTNEISDATSDDDIVVDIPVVKASKPKRKQTIGQAKGLVKALTTKLANIVAKSGDTTSTDKALASAKVNVTAFGQTTKAPTKAKKAKAKVTDMGVMSVEVGKIDGALREFGFSVEETARFTKAIQA